MLPQFQNRCVGGKGFLLLLAHKTIFCTIGIMYEIFRASCCTLCFCCPKRDQKYFLYFWILRLNESSSELHWTCFRMLASKLDTCLTTLSVHLPTYKEPSKVNILKETENQYLLMISLFSISEHTDLALFKGIVAHSPIHD